MKQTTVKELEALLGSSITIQVIRPKFNPRTGRAYIPSTGELVERNLNITGISVEIPAPNTKPQWIAEGFFTETRPSDGAAAHIFTSTPL